VKPLCEPRRYFFTAANHAEAFVQILELMHGDDKYTTPEEVNYAMMNRPLPTTDFIWVPVKGGAAKAGK
jgi:hypothetical protein